MNTLEQIVRDEMLRRAKSDEAKLHEGICAKLCETGRVLPGEAIAKIPQRDGGYVEYYMPERKDTPHD